MKNDTCHCEYLLRMSLQNRGDIGVVCQSGLVLSNHQDGSAHMSYAPTMSAHHIACSRAPGLSEPH